MDYAQSIRNTMDRATDADWLAGSDWYRTAHETAARIADAGNLPVDRAARVLAVLSPRKRWAQNVQAAEIIVDAYVNGADMPSIPGTLGMNVRKAWAIAWGDDSQLRGQKVTRFYQNIMGIDHEVTVDVWAMRAAGVTDHDAPTTAEYRAIADAYRTVAAEYNVPASVLQAVAWTVIRGKAN